MTTSRLGDDLRSGALQVTPSDVGLPQDGRRRVPGLRREEVAMLARISVDYYLRLEQGRERRPSTQVLDALRDALLLDNVGRLHLYRVAGMTPLPRNEGSIERADPQLLTLAELWDRTPALLLGRAYDVLAANTLGRTVFPHLPPGANVLLAMFLDPSVRSFHADWDTAAANAVAGFRFLEGARRTTPGFTRYCRRPRRAAASSPTSGRGETHGARVTPRRSCCIPMSASSPCACRPSTYAPPQVSS